MSDLCRRGLGQVQSVVFIYVFVSEIVRLKILLIVIVSSFHYLLNRFAPQGV